jgi:hypothetical protein
MSILNQKRIPFPDYKKLTNVDENYKNNTNDKIIENYSSLKKNVYLCIFHTYQLISFILIASFLASIVFLCVFWVWSIVVTLFDFNTGCYSFICLKWKLKDFKIIKHINDPTIAYNPTCSCNYCINSDTCECSLLNCIVIAELDNKSYEVLSDYSFHAKSPDIYEYSNIWSYNDMFISGLNINSTHQLYIYDSKNYCYLKEQVYENGKYYYENLMFAMSGLVILLLMYISVCILDIIKKRRENEEKMKAQMGDKIEIELGSV